MAWVLSVCRFSMTVKAASFKLQLFLIMEKLSNLEDCWVFPYITTLVTGNSRCLFIDLDNVVANIPSSCISQIWSYRSVDESILMITRLKKTKVLPLKFILVPFFQVYGRGAPYQGTGVYKKLKDLAARNNHSALIMCCSEWQHELLSLTTIA